MTSLLLRIFLRALRVFAAPFDFSELMTTDATLIVIAGGRGTRMSGPKSRLAYGRKPALRWIADRLAWPGPSLLVTAPSNRAPIGREAFDAEVIDPIDDGGPLLGLLTGLSAARGSHAIFVPVDMPLLTRPLLEEVLAYAQGDPEGRGRMCARREGDAIEIEPFPAVLPTASRDALARHWDAGRRSLRSLLDAGLCATFDATHWPADAWRNVNEPTDLAAVEAIIANGG
jgi:molybdopterin-guanine dinucleotide biosynthesis protein A